MKIIFYVLCIILNLVIYTTAGRYEQLTQWASQGPKMELVSATFYGSTSPEGFTDIVIAPDKTIIAAGTAYGPEFSNNPKPIILGEDSHKGSDPFTVQKDKKVLKEYTPDACGFLVIYAPELKSIKSVIKFGWGVATIRVMDISKDRTALIISGYCNPSKLKNIVPSSVLHEHKLERVTTQTSGRGKSESPSENYNAYIMRITVQDINKPLIKWCWILKDYPRPPYKLWQDNSGNVYFAVQGLVKISADGSEFKVISDKGSDEGQAKYLGIDPVDGSYFFGGDRNTNTGREPWRQPYLYKFSSSGEKLWTLWEWPPKALRDGQGSDEGLVSDSSVRGITFAPNGDLIVVGWSDGGNSIFTRQPKDANKSAGKATGPFTTWGMKSANSIAYLMRIDPKTFDQKAWSYFVAYVPESFKNPQYRGAPNYCSIEEAKVLPNNLVAILGKAATGLISTPNAFYIHSGPNKYGGQFVAVLKEDFSEMLFSSYLPGYELTAMYPYNDGIVIAGTSRKDDGHTDQKPTPPPIKNAIQQNFGGGEYDGHIIFLRNPPGVK